MSLCTGRLLRQTCQRTLRHTSRRDRASAAVTPVWILDAMCLSHFARAERLDVLRDLLVDKECWTTQVVLEELRQGAAVHPALSDVRAADWLRVARLDTLDEVRLFRNGCAA